MQIPSSFLSIAKDTPVFARMLLRNKELTFLPSSRLLPWDDGESVIDETNAMVVKNCVLRSGRREIDTYVVADDDKPIGSSKDGMMMIYRAVWLLTTFVWKPFVALKVADNPESISNLREEVTRSLAVRGTHRNLLRFNTYFMDEQSGKFCVVMPFTHGSLRNLMKNGFSQGFPEDLIICVLYSILCALRFLHEQHIFHGDINAGHIYLCNPSEPLYYNCSEITLGFAATVYEDEMGKNTVTASISKWAAAPEVYNGNQPYSEKADIWLVGITALELAYGGLKVSNRNALEAMIKEIHDKKKLPDIDTIEEEDEMVDKLKYYIKKLVPFWSSSFSAGTFTQIVAQCLAWDPKNRPTADMLLCQQFFNPSCWHLTDESYFYDAVMNNNNKT